MRSEQETSLSLLQVQQHLMHSAQEPTRRTTIHKPKEIGTTHRSLTPLETREKESKDPYEKRAKKIVDQISVSLSDPESEDNLLKDVSIRQLVEGIQSEEGKPPPPPEKIHED